MRVQLMEKRARLAAEQEKKQRMLEAWTKDDTAPTKVDFYPGVPEQVSFGGNFCFKKLCLIG